MRRPRLVLHQGGPGSVPDVYQGERGPIDLSGPIDVRVVTYELLGLVLLLSGPDLARLLRFVRELAFGARKPAP